MFQTSYTKTGSRCPLRSPTPMRDGRTAVPAAGKPVLCRAHRARARAFIQITYDSASGVVHWDNSEIRYAKQMTLAADSLTWGITMNNNPTVQDVWNTTPAWQTPFDQKTNAAPVPGAITQIDGLLTGRGVAGLTTYLWWKNSVYAEFGMYRSSPQGFNVNGLAGPLDSTAGGTLTDNAPYWRLAYEHQWNRNSLSVGMYGMEAKLSPAGQPVASPNDRFRDNALDSQYQYIGDEHIFSARQLSSRRASTSTALSRSVSRKTRPTT